MVEEFDCAAEGTVYRIVKSNTNEKESRR